MRNTIKRTDVEVQILVNGKPIPEYKGSLDKTFVEGRIGSEFSIRIKNHSHSRKRVVVSVDGMNVMNGKADWTDAYVVSGYGDLVIPGWRINKNSVASFIFEEHRNTYANRTNKDTNNNGVIGVKIFEEEKVNYINNDYQIWNSADYYSPIARGMSKGEVRYSSGYGKDTNSYGAISASLSSLQSMSMNQNQIENDDAEQIGTGWGNEKVFNTKTVYYNFEKTPSATFLIYYDTAKGLKKHGIDVTMKNKYPRAFPGEDFGCEIP